MQSYCWLPRTTRPALAVSMDLLVMTSSSIKPCVRKHLSCDEDVSETTDSQRRREREKERELAARLQGNESRDSCTFLGETERYPHQGKRVRVRAVGRAKEDGSPEGQLLSHKETTGSHEEGVKARAVYLNSLPRQIFQNQDCCVVDAMPPAP